VLVAGANYIDTYCREGVHQAALPFGPGPEGTGRVAEDPRGGLAPGTVVAWTGAFASYADQGCVPRHRPVAAPDGAGPRRPGPMPEGVEPEVAASMLLQGITAHYLTHGVYDLKEGDSCLITAAAGGVGLLVTQMAVAKGARVFSVVSTDEKAELAREAGATEVF